MMQVSEVFTRLFKNSRAQGKRVRSLYLIERGKPDEALRVLEEAISVSTELGARYDLAQSYAAVGSILRDRGDPRSAEYIGKASELFSLMKSGLDLAEVQRRAGLATPGPLPQELDTRDKRATTTTLRLTSLLRVCQGISAILDAEKLLRAILESAVSIVGAERGVLFLYEEGELRMKMVHGIEASEHLVQVQVSKSIVKRVERERQPVLTIDAQADPRFNLEESIHRHNMRSILCIPLVRGEKLWGVLYLDNRLIANLFTEQEQELMVAFAAQAAIAIDNASAYRQLEHLTDTLEQRVQQRTEELQAANTKLHEINELKSAFVSVVSHEMRTPMTSIRVYVENMLDGLTGAITEKQKQYLSRIQFNIDRLTRMIIDLLDLSRIEAGRVELLQEPIAIDELMHEVIDNLRSLAGGKSVLLEARHVSSVDAIQADRDKVTQILTNLIGNAIKFTPSGGRVAVTTEFLEDEGMLRFCVSDTGCGIRPDEVPRVFEKFFRGVTTTTDTRGAGLGLAIVKSLVELHGGRIWVESLLGSGSSFFFTLPLNRERESSSKGG
jgi:signal transduction histidine kinase